MAAIESTILMSIVFLSIIAALVFIRDWERAQSSGLDRMTVLIQTLGHPVAWTVIFIFGAGLFALGAIGYVGGSGVIGLGSSVGEMILIGAGISVFVVFLFGGLYAASRNRGMKDAQAAGLSSIALGLLFVFAIAMVLVTT